MPLTFIDNALTVLNYLVDAILLQNSVGIGIRERERVPPKHMDFLTKHFIILDTQNPPISKLNEVQNLFLRL